jgi:hypothetical protein
VRVTPTDGLADAPSTPIAARSARSHITSEGAMSDGGTSGGTEAGGGGAPLRSILVPAAFGVLAIGAGAGIVAAAVTWGAAEAAVGVGAAYLVYTSLAGGGGDGALGTVLRLIAVARRPPPPAGPGERPVE